MAHAFFVPRECQQTIAAQPRGSLCSVVLPCVLRSAAIDYPNSTDFARAGAAMPYAVRRALYETRSSIYQLPP